MNKKLNKKWLTTAEYAEHRNISGRAVREHIKTGRIPPEAVKKPGRSFMIHKTNADKALAGNLNHKLTKKSVEASEKKKRQTISKAGIPKCKSLTEAQKLDREYQAAIRKLTYKEKCGELVSREQVDKEAFDTARQVRDAILSIPDRLSAQLAAMDDHEAIHTLLLKEIRHVLEGLAK